MSLIDFLYGGKKASEVPLWVLEDKMEEIHRRRKKEEEEEDKRREYDRRMEEIHKDLAIKRAYENAYIDEVIRRVEKNGKRARKWFLGVRASPNHTNN